MTVHLDVIMGGEVADRVQSGIAKMREATRAMTSQQQEHSNKVLDITTGEYITFQNVRAAAQAGGLLSFEESQSLYEYLGESHRAFNAQEIAIKLVVTKVITVLMPKLGMV